ncbi:carboxypeptidase-like protein [Mariniflexile fucanivorans]|uniref:Carboxypeptidase-like protein n=1 Tax=Mariniflexile fucanivorans TaxID=264023 RepID=A0A4R1RIX7_9FLAO|nr:carboxypeptidase-like regulatory domain-containing protein [Mariniflexile fucanivorans]TCL66063.1 carboxypeptidase-like protein [Mariniflexile fucanivorans]
MIPYKITNQKSILYLLVLIMLLQIDICFSQNQISGHVFSAKDSTAIYGASVYFDRTSIGASTNDKGYFKILFEKSNSSLIISSIGYETVIINPQNILINKTLPNIYLSEKSEDLETVYIEMDSWSRSKKLEIFKREFLGTNKAAKLCDIINENSIKLRYVNSSNTLIATSNEPLIIENKYLGYTLKYSLRDFQVKFKTNEKDSTMPLSINYHGFSFFEPLENKLSGKISRNRKKSYLGSTSHFMKALYLKELDENNFKIYYQWVQVPTYEYFEITEYENTKHVKLLVNEIQIRYKTYEQSFLIAKDVFTIDYSGHLDPPESINIRGEMSKKRISELLPLGYEP